MERNKNEQIAAMNALNNAVIHTTDIDKIMDTARLFYKFIMEKE